MQMRQGLEKGVAILDLKGDLLDQPLARAGSGHVHARRGRADHEVVVHVVKPQEGGLRTVGPLVAISDLTPQHLSVETERTLEVRDQEPDVSYTLNLDTHIPFPPSLLLSLPMPEWSPPPGAPWHMPHEDPAMHPCHGVRSTTSLLIPDSAPQTSPGRPRSWRT